MKRDLSIEEIINIFNVPESKKTKHIRFDIYKQEIKLRQLKSDLQKEIDLTDKKVDKAVNHLDSLDDNWRRKLVKHWREEALKKQNNKL